MLGLVAHACNPRNLVSEVGCSQIQCHPGLQSDSLFQRAEGEKKEEEVESKGVGRGKVRSRGEQINRGKEKGKKKNAKVTTFIIQFSSQITRYSVTNSTVEDINSFIFIHILSLYSLPPLPLPLPFCLILKQGFTM